MPMSSAMRLEQIATTPVGKLPPRPVVRVRATDPMWRVVSAMTDGARGAVLVEDAADKLVGIFTERDVMTRLEHDNLDWLHVVVGDVMTPNPMVIAEAEPVAEAIRRLHEGRRRHLPVVDDGGAVISLLSIRDLLAYVVERFPEDFVNLPPRPDRESSGPWGG
jgi:CBS domain-containing protein